MSDRKIHLKLIHNIKEFLLGMSIKNPDLVLASSETWSSSSKRCLQRLRFSPSPFCLLTGFLSGLHAVRPEVPAFPMVAKWLQLFQTSHLYTTSLKGKREQALEFTLSLIGPKWVMCLSLNRSLGWGCGSYSGASGVANPNQSPRLRNWERWFLKGKQR